MAKVPTVGDEQKMITGASMGAMVCIAGTVFSAAVLALEYVKPGTVDNPIAGAVVGGLLLAFAVFFLRTHKGSPRRKRTITDVFQKEDGKTYMTVRYMDDKIATIPADGTQ